MPTSWIAPWTVDADRQIGLGDDKGRILDGDIFWSFWRVNFCCASVPAATIIADVKASPSAVSTKVARADRQAVDVADRAQPGQVKMAETGAPLAGEMSVISSSPDPLVRPLPTIALRRRWPHNSGIFARHGRPQAFPMCPRCPAAGDQHARGCFRLRRPRRPRFRG